MMDRLAPGSQHEKREPPAQSATIWKRTAQVSEVAAKRSPIQGFAASATEAEVFGRRNGDIGGDDANGRLLAAGTVSR